MGCGKGSILGQKRLLIDLADTFSKPDSNHSKVRNRSVKITLREKVDLRLGHLYQFYEIGEIIGEGSFGCVRRGRQLTTGHEVAIKTILKSYVQRADDTNAIIEVEVLRQLDHPNILKIIEVIEDTRNYHIITELCTGGELFEKLLSLKTLSESTVSCYMNQLISALAFCHEQGVLHRDLKPENFLLQSDLNDSPLKIIDFGVSDLNCSSQVIDLKQYTSVFYRAPEQFSGICSEKSDVWSFGVIIYLMLSGYLPFKGKNEKQMAESIKNTPLSFSSKEWDGVSDDAKDLLMHLLEKDPGQRYSARQAFQHNWIQNGHSQYLFDRTVSQIGIKNLMKFRFHLKLRHAVLEFIISHFTHNTEIYELQQAFIAMDINGDGRLSWEEINVACMLLDYSKDEFQSIMNECDANMNGCIDYTEFLTAASNWKKIINKNKLKATFEAFDLDRDGVICLWELKEVLKNDHNVEEDIWQEIFEEVDANKDGKIDFEEFEAAVLLKGVTYMEHV
jgi:calcium-dependent protein kinase